MVHRSILVLLLITSILFAGCLTGEEKIPASSTLDVKPQDMTVKSGENVQLMIRVTNSGKSVIHPFVRFNLNASDKKYVKFSNESGIYDLGTLRPGEDSGFRIVDLTALLAAGKEMKYQTRAQVIYGGKVLESKDIVITVRG